MDNNEIKFAVLPSAGLGTRFLPFTKAVPKVLALAFDRPLIHLAVLEALAAKIENIIIVISEGQESIRQYFEPDTQVEKNMRDRGLGIIADELKSFREKLNFIFVIQEEQKGLGHAVLLCEQLLVGEPFVVILPDDLLINSEPELIRMIDAWSQYPGNYVAVETIDAQDAPNYGVAEIVKQQRSESRFKALKGMVEKPSIEAAPSNLGVIGRYVLMPTIFDAIRDTRPGAIKEIQLTDAINSSIDNMPTYAYMIEGVRYDCGTPQGLMKASIEIFDQTK